MFLVGRVVRLKNTEESYKKALHNNPYEYYILKDSLGNTRDTIYQLKTK